MDLESPEDPLAQPLLRVLSKSEWDQHMLEIPLARGARADALGQGAGEIVMLDGTVRVLSSLVMIVPALAEDDVRMTLVARWRDLPMRVRMAAPLGDDELFAFCAANRDLQIERTADGELLIMSPTGGETGRRNFDLTGQFAAWVRRNGTGIGFDSSTGFLLPNGAERAPDLAWVTKARWNALSDAQRRKFPPLCPDFVLELRSPSDTLAEQRAKLEEYIACGARLGWLLEPDDRRVHVYRPGRAAEILDGVTELRGDPELPGLVIDLRSIW